MRKLAIYLAAFFAFSASPCFAETTTGGVNFIDPLGYTKPAFYPIAYPSEADCGSNVYYVDRASGSGTTCSAGSPCAWAGLSGKAGMAGGPARIYLKGGTANMSITSGMYGSAGNEIVIKPWPGDATISQFNSGGTYGNRIGGSTAHHIIFDGGPDMQFLFNGYGGSGQTNYNTTVAGDYITFYRCRFDNNDISGPIAGAAVGSGTYVSYVYWINCEFYDADSYYGFYHGGGTGCEAGDTGYDHVYHINSIFREIGGRGIQIEPRDYSQYTYVIGNAFHDIGYDLLSAAVQPAAACGGTNSHLYVYNNIAWDLAGGFFYINGSATNAYAWNNTVFDFAKSSSAPSTASHAFTCDSGGMTARNNIAFKSNEAGVITFNRCSFTQSNNICDDGNCTGYASDEATEFASYNPDSSDFLKIKTGADAINHGYDMSGTFTGSYFADTRSGTFDIGADELGEPEGGDTTAPAVSGLNPAASATNVSKATNIVAHVTDAGDGVDQSTIVMTVEGSAVTPTISGTSADYTLTYNPPSDFAYEQVVNVTIDADDLAANSMTQYAYSFTILPNPGVTSATDMTFVGVSVKRD